MNRKSINILSNIDYTTLADIANKEKENINGLNIYYDIYTNEAIVYPEDDKPNVKLRPLKNRLLKQGVRLNSELSILLADSIEYAIKTDRVDIAKDILKNRTDVKLLKIEKDKEGV